MWAVEFVEQLLINSDWVAVIPPLPFSRGALVFLIFSDGGNYNLIPYVALFTCRHKYNKQTNISLLLEVWLAAKLVARVLWVLKRFSFISLLSAIHLWCLHVTCLLQSFRNSDIQLLWTEWKLSLITDWIKQTRSLIWSIQIVSSGFNWGELLCAWKELLVFGAAHITNNERRTI